MSFITSDTSKPAHVTPRQKYQIERVDDANAVRTAVRSGSGLRKRATSPLVSFYDAV